MVIERERTIRSLGERLREANERHDRSIASLESVAARLEEGVGGAGHAGGPVDDSEPAPTEIELPVPGQLSLDGTDDA